VRQRTLPGARITDDAADRDVRRYLNGACSKETHIGAAMWIIDPAVTTAIRPIPLRRSRR
jgi:hypothetical protein